MPYTILERDNQYCVALEDSDSPIEGGCYPSLEGAQAHLGALEANVPEAQSSVIRSPQLIEVKYSGGILKRTSPTKFEGYAVRYHDKDRPDLQGEWFSKATYFMKNAGYPIVGKPVNYQHGLQENFGNLAIGMLTFNDETDIGEFIEGELKTRDEYLAMLHELGRVRGFNFTDSQINQKAELAYKTVDRMVSEIPLQFSGGFDPTTWKVNNGNHHIDQAGLIHLAFTPTPADDLNPIVRFKSAWDEVLKYEPTTTYSIPAATPAGLKEAIEPKETTGITDGDSSANQLTSLSTKGHHKMELSEIIAGLQAMLQGLIEHAEGMGMGQAEAATLAAETTDELEEEYRAKQEEEKPDEEEDMKQLTVEVLAGKALDLLQAKIAKRQRNVIDARSAIVAKRQSFAANQPAQFPPAHTGGSPNAWNRYPTVKTRYHSWTPEDFSFAIMVQEMSKGGQKKVRIPDLPEFYREFADKAIKAYEDNKLLLDPAGIKTFRGIKANELDHSTQDGFGDEYVPTIWADQVWERPRADNVIQNIFESVEMPSNPYEHPVESTDPTLSFVPETTAEAELTLDSSSAVIPDSKVGTDKVTFTAKKFALRVGWSQELEEDALSRLIPQFRAQAERTVQDGIDHAAINGDTAASGNINLDGGTPATTAIYKAYDGMIKQPLVTSTTNRLDASAAAPSLTLLRAVRALLGTGEAVNPENLVWIMDFPTYMKLLSDDTVVTVDKYGAAATVLTGELGRIDGIRVYVSGQMALADADGKITSGGNVVNRGRAVLAHRPSWKMGFRRRITQSLTFLPFYDAWQLVITVRNDFKVRTATDGTQQSTDDSTGILYNIGV